MSNVTQMPHTEHITVEAYQRDCIEGECEHVGPDGEPHLEICAAPTEVCVDCMVAKGAGSEEEEGWDDWPLSLWPHGSAL